MALVERSGRFRDSSSISAKCDRCTCEGPAKPGRDGFARMGAEYAAVAQGWTTRLEGRMHRMYCGNCSEQITAEEEVNGGDAGFSFNGGDIKPRLSPIRQRLRNAYLFETPESILREIRFRKSQGEAEAVIILKEILAEVVEEL